MRAIIYGNCIDELVQIGETVALVGFCAEPIIATAVLGHSDCTGCALRQADCSCNVFIMNNGIPRSISACCIKPSWLTKDKESVEFCTFSQQGSALEEL